MSDQNADNNDLHFTERRVIDQLGHLLPQIHLTLVSILQSVALAFLLASVHGPSAFTPQAILKALVTHNFYLPHLVSFILIVIAWNQFASATLFLYWPLTGFSTALQFLVTVGEIAAFTNVDVVGIWTIWIGLICLLAGYIHHRNIGITSDELYGVYGNVARKRAASGNRYYWLLGLLIPIGVLRALAIMPVAATVTIAGNFMAIYDVVIPLCLCVIGMLLMRMDDDFFRRYINNVLEQSGSRYGIDRRGRIVDTRAKQPAEMLRSTDGE
jgi:hypothetical protein